MSKTVFEKGHYRVTDKMVRAWNRSIQLETIEGVDLGRPIFLMALGTATGMLGLGLLFGDLLYWHETSLAVLVSTCLLAGTWQLGSLRVFSKLTGDKGWAVLGRHSTLSAMRDAIELRTSFSRSEHVADHLAGDDD